MLSEKRREKADFYKFRKEQAQSVTAGLFIGLVEKEFGKVTVDGNGKLHSPGIEFNISHSGRYVAFAYSESPVGVDIEKIGRNMDIAKRVMTSDEFNEFMDAVGESDREDVFCRMWTAKESYMKYRGLGFRLPPESFRVLYGYDLRSPDPSVSIKELEPPEGYRLCVCSAYRKCISKTVTIKELIGTKSLKSSSF